MQRICSVILMSFLVLSNVAGQTNRKVELTKTTEYERSAPSFGPNGMMMGGGMTPKAKYGYYIEGENVNTELTYLGDNLKAVLDPKSGAVNQMNLYSGKRVGAILGGIGFVAFALLSATAGMEETGETTTKPDQYGNLETTRDKSVTGLGYTFLGLSGASAICGLYCHFSRGINLRNAVRMHNDYVEGGNRTSLVLNVEF